MFAVKSSFCVFDLRLAMSAIAGLAALVGCGAGSQPKPSPPCDQACQDGTALLGVRSMMKFAFNEIVQGQPIGAQDGVQSCLPDDAGVGFVHVTGMATANAVQGASEVMLSYDFENCSYSAPPDPSAGQNYDLIVTGIVSEAGTISVQPTATTALSIESNALSISGTVYDPSLDYATSDCVLAANQNGNALAGSWCGRSAGFNF